MKVRAAIIPFVFVIHALGYAGSETAPNPARPPGFPARDWDITITIINQFQCPYAGEIRGLDYVDGQTSITFASDPDDKYYTCSANDGTYISDLDLAFGGNAHPFGLCYDANGQVHGNEFSGSDIYLWDGATWQNYVNPSSNKGSGMDFDGTYIWETYWTDGVYRFLPDGTGAEFYATPEVGAQLSGLTVFPFNSNLWLMNASHGQYIFNFYEFDGSTMTYVATVDCPLTPSQSYGLTYAAERGTFFWSYAIGSDDWIAELDIDISGGDTTVTPASIGVVKAAYR